MKKTMIKAVFELASPLCVSNGSEENTDKDVMRDYDRNVFIPGTSIAGALKQYLSPCDRKKVFGYIERIKKDGDFKTVSVESPIIVYDAEIKNSPKIGLRDGIALDDCKITLNTGKFDYETIETGAKTEFRFLMAENGCELSDHIKNLVLAVDSGDIRFGSKKNRGLGRLKLREIYKSDFDENNVRDYLKFGWDKMKTPWEFDKKDDGKYEKLTIPLILSGGISVRTYSAKPNEPDYTHIKCAGQPVIPGSTWNGAIRHRTKDILLELGVCKEKTEHIIQYIFGSKAGELTAAASKIVFLESVIKGGTEIPMTRNRINRFDSSTMDGALYSETSHFQGKCDLEIMLKGETDEKWIWGLMSLVIKDIKYGFLSVGGQTAVGRGLFADDEKFEIKDEAECIRALNKKLEELGLEANCIAV